MLKMRKRTKRYKLVFLYILMKKASIIKAVIGYT